MTLVFVIMKMYYQNLYKVYSIGMFIFKIKINLLKNLR